jgi:hypothetical protein
MIISPPIDQPAVPYPPALTEGEKECFAQNRTILKRRSELMSFRQEPRKSLLVNILCV